MSGASESSLSFVDVPWVLWNFSHIEVEQIGEDLGGAVTKLGESISTIFSVHIAPFLLLEYSDSLTNLSNQTESIGL